MNPPAPVSVEGGITAARGFRAAGVACGIKASGAPDLALIVPDVPATAAAVFTTNRAQAAPVLLSRRHLAQSAGRIAAIVVNSGCANACTGEQGEADAAAMAAATASAVSCRAEEVLVASTGVIGVALDMSKVSVGIRGAFATLSRDGMPAARAIMTTDRAPKEAAVEQALEGGSFRIGGIAKGAGMIEPNMATMLAFLTTDARVEPERLQRALLSACEVSFNAITVDGDTSTNDTLAILASGASGVEIDDERHALFVAALTAVCDALARAIVRGGEGVTKLVTLEVAGAASPEEARRAARTIANSLLVKTAVHGGDPNWGRLLAAAGRSGVAFDLARARVRVGPVVLFADGRPFDDLAPRAADYLRGADIDIEVDLGTSGPHRARMITGDLSAEYVRINAEYRT
jgi:glutamate N-acetyltransferase / amino-acid N-acetyltransferase